MPEKSNETQTPLVVINTDANQGQKPEAPKLVEVEVGGSKVKVDEVTAAAIKAMQASTSKAINDLQAELTEAKKPTPAKATPKPGGTDTDDLAVQLFADPAGTLAKFQKAAAEDAVKQVMAAYQQQQNQTSFWAEFYKQNPDLRDSELVVNAVFQRDFAALQKGTVADAIKAIAESSKSEVLKLKGGKTSGGKHRPDSEAGNHPTPERSETPEGEGESKGSSLSDVLKARRDARRKASTGG